MLVAEQQFRRIIGYKDLAKLVIAVERHAILIAEKNPDRQEVAEPTRSDRQLEDRHRSSTTIGTSSSHDRRS